MSDTLEVQFLNHAVVWIPSCTAKGVWTVISHISSFCCQNVSFQQPGSSGINIRRSMNCIPGIWVLRYSSTRYSQYSARSYKSILYCRGVSKNLTPQGLIYTVRWKMKKTFSIVYPCFAFSMGFLTSAISVLNRLKDSCCDIFKIVKKSPLCLFLICLELPWILKTAILLGIVMTVMILVMT